MRNLLTAAAVAAIMAGSAGVPAFAQPPGGRGGPQGGYQGGAPQAEAGPPAGSYQRSCRNIQAGGGQLTAECRDIHSNYIRSTLPYGQCRTDIQSNPDGVLSCGPIRANQVANNNDRRDDRRDDRGGNNNAAAAAIAGAVAGALLGANGQPVAPPPNYGDPRYGDPRYDYRYQQGWWGYGRRPGEWVSIRDRADWLDMRIDRALRQGRISRGDARDLRRQLSFIEDMQDRYMRDGRLGPRERADLDRRFDDLSQRIRFEAGPGGGGYRGDDRYRDDYRR